MGNVTLYEKGSLPLQGSVVSIVVIKHHWLPVNVREAKAPSLGKSQTHVQCVHCLICVVGENSA